MLKQIQEIKKETIHESTARIKNSLRFEDGEPIIPRIPRDILLDAKYSQINPENYEFKQIKDLQVWDIFRLNKKIWIRGCHRFWTAPGEKTHDTISLNETTKNYTVAVIK